MPPIHHSNWHSTGVQSCGILFENVAAMSTGAWEGQKGEMSDTRAKGGKLRRVLLVRSDCFFFLFVEAQRGGEEQGKAGTACSHLRNRHRGETWTLPRGAGHLQNRKDERVMHNVLV